MEIRFKTDANFIEGIRRIIGVRDENEVVKEALTLLNWAAQEANNDRILLSSTKDFKNIHILKVSWLRIQNNKNDGD